uniref:Uncharacterized protein n=1 Tax=Anguilla anguilla TaxID=7936 RepID=A0A0E9W1R9_ANGAN
MKLKVTQQAVLNTEYSRPRHSLTILPSGYCELHIRGLLSIL